MISNQSSDSCPDGLSINAMCLDLYHPDLVQYCLVVNQIGQLRVHKSVEIFQSDSGLCISAKPGGWSVWEYLWSSKANYLNHRRDVLSRVNVES